jgi:arylsulfatase A-like enzyme
MISLRNRRGSGLSTHNRAPIIAALLAALVALGLSACSRRGAPAEPPNLIIITMDTMRADHMSCYGYERPTSPRMDELAQTSTLYSRHMASSPWTVPSHASLFTGKDPFEHGSHTFPATSRVQNVNPLHDGHTTLAEALRKEGYSTGAFVANDGMLALRWQLDQGFQTYHIERTLASVLNERVFSWLDSVTVVGDPFMLFVNYMDTHKVYNTTPRPGFLEKPAIQDKGELLERLYETVMPGTGPIPWDLAQKVIDQYDTAIANLDEQIGLLIDRLQAMKLYDNTMIVLTSDHGEFFGEHYLVEHSKDVYQEVIWVPLIIKNPGQQAGQLDDTVVSNSDVPRLVLSGFPDKMVKPYLAEFPNAPGNHPVITENYYTRARDLFHPVWGKRFDRVRTAVYNWPYKFILSSDGNSELYHIEYDVKESTNLITRQSEVAKEMAETLELFLKSRPRFEERASQPPLTDKELKALRSLGYIGN